MTIGPTTPAARAVQLSAWAWSDLRINDAWAPWDSNPQPADSEGVLSTVVGQRRLGLRSALKVSGDDGCRSSLTTVWHGRFMGRQACLAEASRTESLMMVRCQPSW